MCCRNLFRFSQTVYHSSIEKETGGLAEAHAKAAKEREEIARAVEIATAAGTQSVQLCFQNIQRSQRKKIEDEPRADDTVSPLLKGIEMYEVSSQLQQNKRHSYNFKEQTPSPSKQLKNIDSLTSWGYEETKGIPSLPKSQHPEINTMYSNFEEDYFSGIADSNHQREVRLCAASNILFGTGESNSSEKASNMPEKRI
mmetsp:Transcript_23485/g.30517  ORF Transcript_23485/g.30517 Transcript_23485/m.30517 type:complete len:198 (-) Transcript_23485:92-685(-)